MRWSCRPFNHHGALNGGMSFSPIFLTRKTSLLFLAEESVERLAGVGEASGAGCPPSRRVENRAHLEKIARVRGALAWERSRDRLRARESGRCVEVSAIPAAVQRRAAGGAGALGRHHETGRQRVA